MRSTVLFVTGAVCTFSGIVQVREIATTEVADPADVATWTILALVGIMCLVASFICVQKEG